MTITTTRPVSSRRIAYARSAVFAEFPARDARAIDQGTFADRAPAPITEPLGRGISALSHEPFPPEVSSGLSAQHEKKTR